jgi:archaeosine synthase beta-subunit
MRMPYTTGLLSQIAKTARAGRERFAPPESHVHQVTPEYAEVWFPTGGCIWDELGHCTTCNYGAPQPVSPDAMVRAIEVAVPLLAPTTRTLWVSAFDTLQEREVPADARRRIFRLLGTTPARTVITEAHPASVRAHSVAECVELLDGRTFAIQLGAETMDEFTRYTCVNKPFTNLTLERAVRSIRDVGAQAWANIIVGLPFLTEAEIVDGSARSITEAVGAGFEQVVVFPNHVKENTIADLLARAGRYTPPDLWMIRDVLAGISREIVERVHLGWLDLKSHPGAPNVAFEPDPARTERLRSLLKSFDLQRNLADLDEAFALEAPERPERKEGETLIQRIASQYRWLADTQKGPVWWATNEAAVTAELEAAYAAHLAWRSR